MFQIGTSGEGYRRIRKIRCNSESSRSSPMSRITLIVLLLAITWLALPTEARAQGETTSAIAGQVNDPTNAGVPGATVTITDQETGLKRVVKTDDSGQFNFPQLKPGTYSAQVEADGFAPQRNDDVNAGLGQKQTITFALKLAESGNVRAGLFAPAEVERAGLRGGRHSFHPATSSV